MTGTIIAAIIAAAAGVVVALVGIVPNVGRLHRLERVVAILEKVEEPEQRTKLLALRDRLIDRLTPSLFPILVGLVVTLVVTLVGYGLVFYVLISSLFAHHPSRLALTQPEFVVGVVISVLGFTSYMLVRRVGLRERRVRDAERLRAKEQEVRGVLEEKARRWWTRDGWRARRLLGTSGLRRARSGSRRR